MTRIADANLKATALTAGIRFTASDSVDRKDSVLKKPDVLESENSDRRGSGQLSNPILSRIAAGDIAAVDECLQQYGALVWSIAKRLSRSAADAEDAAQDVFVELWQKADRFDPTISSESTFIAMVARRRLIDRLRKARPQVDLESVDPDVLSHNDHSQGNAELRDEAAKAAKCLDRLPNQQQQVIALSVHQGASHRVIAEQLDLPLGTVKTFARRGLIQIRDCMSRRLTPQVERGVS